MIFLHTGFILLLTLVVLSQAVSIQCVVSSRTPIDVEPLVRSVFGASVRVHFSAEAAFEIDSLVLDYSYDVRISLALPQSQTLVLWPRSDECGQTLKPSAKTAAQELTRYLVSLNFTGVLLVVDDDAQRLQAGREVVEEFSGVYDEVIAVPLAASLDFMLQFVGKIIKPTGRNLVAILSEETTALSFLQAVERKKLNKAGFAYVLADSAALYRKSAQRGLLATGVLYVAPMICAEARSLEDCELAYLSAIAAWVSSGTTQALRDSIDLSFVLVGVQNSTPRVLATSPDSLDLSSAVFAGDSAVLPRRQKTVISTSVNYDWINAGVEINKESRRSMRGAEIAFEERNNGTDFAQGFHVHDEAVALMGTSYNYSFTLANVLQSRAHLGVIHFPFPGGVQIAGLSRVLQGLNITLPMCMSCPLAALASPTEYPMFLRPRTNSRYVAMVIGKMCQHFGWRQLAVLYAKDGGDNEDLYIAFLNYSQVYKINITNEPAFRVLTDNFALQTTAQLNASLAKVIQSPTRILLIFYYGVERILEAMYDMGVRSEYLILAWTGLSYTLFAGDDFKYEKRRVVGRGALQFLPRSFVGKVGQRVLQTLLARDGSLYFPNTCYYYDSVMLYLYANEYLIRMGLDYEDPYEIIRAMRGTHFKGCTGTVTITPGTNEVSASEFALLNLKYSAGNHSLVIEDVMYYNPFSVTLFKAVSPIMWPDNATGVYTDTFISLFDCPFLEKQVRDSPTGRTVGLVISVAVCCLTTVAATIIWKCCWARRYPAVAPHTELSADDIMQMLALPLECFQYVGIGPESKELSSIIATITKLTTLQLENVLSATGKMYWFLVYVCLGSVGWHSALSVLKLKGLEKKLECLPLWSLLMLFANLVLPVLSNLMFLPIVSTLSKLFLCYRSVGDSLQSSFLDKDCYTFCWTGSHLIFAACGAGALTVYVPLCIYAKPMWQEVQPTLHIKAQPLALMLKSVLQVALLALCNTLKGDNPDAHGSAFFVCLSLYIVFLLRVPPYNYNRLNMWTVISMCLVLSFAVAAFIAQKNPALGIPLLIAFAALTAVSLAVGIVLQRLAKPFATCFYHRHLDTRFIIGFAFSFGNRAVRYLDTHMESKFFTMSDGPSRVPVHLLQAT